MTLLLVAHGTRDPAGAQTAAGLVDAVANRLPDTTVRLAFADVRGPTVPDVLAELAGPVTVVPAFLASGYHVRVDLPAQLAGRPDVCLTEPLGPAPGLVAVAKERLVAAGWHGTGRVVLAAAWSSDARARADVTSAANLLSRAIRRRVDVGYVGQTDMRRAAVASWLLAPGLFHRWLRESGADVVSDPLGTHPLVADEIVRRYESNRPGWSSRAARAASVTSDHR